jgi:hypothetical protein
VKLPDQIVIGPVTYDVRETPELKAATQDSDAAPMFGVIRWASGLIEIEAEQMHDRKVVTLWHEIVHGILENAGLDDQPEQVVFALGFGLVQLIRDNPELVRVTTMRSPEPALPVTAHDIVPGRLFNLSPDYGSLLEAYNLHISAALVDYSLPVAVIEQGAKESAEWGEQVAIVVQDIKPLPNKMAVPLRFLLRR